MNETETSQPEAGQYVANARSLLENFEDNSTEEKHGVLLHAMEELHCAKRVILDD